MPEDILRTIYEFDGRSYAKKQMIDVLDDLPREYIKRSLLKDGRDISDISIFTEYDEEYETMFKNSVKRHFGQLPLHITSEVLEIDAENIEYMYENQTFDLRDMLLEKWRDIYKRMAFDDISEFLSIDYDDLKFYDLREKYIVRIDDDDEDDEEEVFQNNCYHYNYSEEETSDEDLSEEEEPYYHSHNYNLHSHIPSFSTI